MNNVLSNFSKDIIDSLKNHYIKDGEIKSKGIWYESTCKLFPDFATIFNTLYPKDIFREVMYCLLTNTNNIPKCKNPNCNNYVKLRNYKDGFQKCCCKQCISEMQKTSIQFKESCSAGSKKHHKEKHKETFIDKYDYCHDGNYYVLRNYCKHGDVRIYFKTAELLEKRNSCMCIECNKETYNNYCPTNDDIANFQKDFANFYNTYKHNIKIDWFIQYFPKELKIIRTYFERYINDVFDDTTLLEACYQFMNDLKGRPKCLECNKEVSFTKSIEYGYRKFCDDHLYGFNKSSLECNVNEYIDTLGIKYESNKVGIIDNELDIYFPDRNFAIEFNGCWWHCNKFKSNDYHYKKWKQCVDKGIQLMYIWEDDWLFKQSIIKSIIKSKLGLYEHRVYARNCKLKIIDSKIAKEFLNTYHLQGYAIDKYRLGLFYNDELVSIMTFGKSRFKSNDIEIIRYCCKDGWQIIGGANKFYRNFKKMFNVDKIVSYADADISIGNLYKTLGMHEIGITDNWKWLYRGKRYNRLNKIRFKNDELFKCYSVGTLKFES